MREKHSESTVHILPGCHCCWCRCHHRHCHKSCLTSKSRLILLLQPSSFCCTSVFLFNLAPASSNPARQSSTLMCCCLPLNLPCPDTGNTQTRKNSHVGREAQKMVFRHFHLFICSFICYRLTFSFFFFLNNKIGTLKNNF